MYIGTLTDNIVPDCEVGAAPSVVLVLVRMLVMVVEVAVFSVLGYDDNGVDDEICKDESVDIWKFTRQSLQTDFDGWRVSARSSCIGPGLHTFYLSFMLIVTVDSSKPNRYNDTHFTHR